MGGVKEGVKKSEESRSMLGVEDVAVQERVELGVEGWIVQIAFLNQIEDTGQRKQRHGAARVVAAGEEICEHLRPDEPWSNDFRHDVQDAFSLVLAVDNHHEC